jgi:hypothetical protein
MGLDVVNGSDQLRHLWVGEFQPIDPDCFDQGVRRVLFQKPAYILVASQVDYFVLDAYMVEGGLNLFGVPASGFVGIRQKDNPLSSHPKAVTPVQTKRFRGQI